MPVSAETVDPLALPQSPALPRQPRRRALVFASVGVLAYCIGLIALIPASLVLPKSDRWQVGGTIWNGEAVLAGTTRIAWKWSALASLSRFAVAAKWHMTGGETDLAGIASPRLHQLRLDSVSGVADGNLLAVAAPTLPVTCRFLAQVNIDQAIIGGSDQQMQGNVRTSPVHCSATAMAVATAMGAIPTSAAALDLPPLHGTMGSAHGLSSGALFTLPSRQHLVEVRLHDTGALSLWPTFALTRRVPALGGMRLDTHVAW